MFQIRLLVLLVCVSMYEVNQFFHFNFLRQTKINGKNVAPIVSKQKRDRDFFWGFVFDIFIGYDSSHSPPIARLPLCDGVLHRLYRNFTLLFSYPRHKLFSKAPPHTQGVVAVCSAKWFSTFTSRVR